MLSKQEQILEVAEELFAEHGYEGTSVRLLAQKAGINVAMVSYYFGSKEKLFEALVEYRASFMRNKLQHLNKEIADPVLRIDQMVELYVDRIFSHRRFHKILYRQISLQQRSGLNEAIHQILLKNVDELRKMVKDGIEKKVFREVETDLFIATIVGTISQVTLSSLLVSKIMGEKHVDCDQYSDQLKSRLIHYLKDLSEKYLLANPNQTFI